MGVKVHLLQRVAGPAGNWPAGRTIEVSEQEAQALVAVHAAERIDSMAPYVELTAEDGRPEKSKREKAVDKGAVKRETADEK